MPSSRESSAKAVDGLHNACISCRSRKLKCDKSYPCSNCQARSVECKQQQLVHNRGVRKRDIPSNTDASSTLTAILSRLERIEATIGKNALEELQPTSPPPRSSETRTDFGHDPGTSTALAEAQSHSDTFRRESGRMVSLHANDDSLVRLNPLKQDIPSN
jgi:Fungal Zn(2)-Cys(6) binuclear cluster domain